MVKNLSLCSRRSRDDLSARQPPITSCTALNASAALCHKFFHPLEGLCQWLEPVGACNSGCANNANAWSSKCKWVGKCEGCAECLPASRCAAEPSCLLHWSTHESRRGPRAPPSPLPSPPAPPAPPAPPSRPPASVQDVVGRLNRRYQKGAPSADLRKAGVLLHTWDKTEDSVRKWQPCAQGWCAPYGDRMAATLISAATPGWWHGYGQGGGSGLIFSPKHAQPFVRCSYGEDGGSMKAPKGCNPKACTPSSPFGCSWHGAEGLPGMLQYQRALKHGLGYNEVVLEGHSGPPNFKLGWPLPEMIEAFYETRGSSSKAVHREFVRVFGKEAAATTFRVRIDTAANATAPFMEVSDEDDRE